VSLFTPRTIIPIISISDRAIEIKIRPNEIARPMSSRIGNFHTSLYGKHNSGKLFSVSEDPVLHVIRRAESNNNSFSICNKSNYSVITNSNLLYFINPPPQNAFFKKTNYSSK
jgi:hypothetical protein